MVKKLAALELAVHQPYRGIALTTAGDDVTFLAVEHRSGVRSHLGATSLAGVPGPRTRLLGRAAAYLVANVADETTPHVDWRDVDDQLLVAIVEARAHQRGDLADGLGHGDRAPLVLGSPA